MSSESRPSPKTGCQLARLHARPARWAAFQGVIDRLLLMRTDPCSRCRGVAVQAQLFEVGCEALQEARSVERYVEHLERARAAAGPAGAEEIDLGNVARQATEGHRAGVVADRRHATAGVRQLQVPVGHIAGFEILDSQQTTRNAPPATATHKALRNQRSKLPADTSTHWLARPAGNAKILARDGVCADKGTRTSCREWAA